MNTTPFGATSRPQPQGVNPFARALAEARGGQGSTDHNFSTPHTAVNNPYSTGMGNGWLNESGMDNMSAEDQQRAMAEQQRLQQEQQKKERLRQQLHRQVNPVETTDVFNAKQQQVERQIKEVREELKLLVKEVAEFSKDVEIAVLEEVAAPGHDGSYYFSFFEKLKAFIILLRTKIHSARTWATTMQSKKKRRGKTPGLEIAGKTHEQTATVFDRMHHERAALYSGS